MANIFLEIGKGIEVAAEDALAFFAKAQKAAPGVIAALAVLGAATEKALADAEGAAANPASLLLNLSGDIADFKAEWPAVKAFLESLGVKL